MCSAEHSGPWCMACCHWWCVLGVQTVGHYLHGEVTAFCSGSSFMALFLYSVKSCTEYTLLTQEILRTWHRWKVLSTAACSSFFYVAFVLSVATGIDHRIGFRGYVRQHKDQPFWNDNGFGYVFIGVHFCSHNEQPILSPKPEGIFSAKCWNFFGADMPTLFVWFYPNGCTLPLIGGCAYNHLVGFWPQDYILWLTPISNGRACLLFFNTSRYFHPLQKMKLTQTNTFCFVTLEMAWGSTSLAKSENHQDCKFPLKL